MSAGRRLAVIPMKDPARAKTRLCPRLDADGRAVLALALFEATVARLRAGIEACPAGVDLAVVTCSATIRSAAAELGLTVIDDGGAGDLSPALERAAAWGAARGYDGLCILPGDLADPAPSELARLLSAPLDGRAVICPAKDLGTNALMVPLPRPFPFAYGTRSAAVHLAAAEAAGLRAVLMPLPSLRLDVDTVADLDRLLGSQDGDDRREGVQ